jgi:hypothetical protein
MTALPNGVSRAQAERTSAVERQQASAAGTHRFFGTAEVSGRKGGATALPPFCSAAQVKTGSTMVLAVPSSCGTWP